MGKHPDSFVPLFSLGTRGQGEEGEILEHKELREVRSGQRLTRLFLPDLLDSIFPYLPCRLCFFLLGFISLGQMASCVFHFISIKTFLPSVSLLQDLHI
jgi:hypothetical protein